jgi:hypothetical protein
LAIGAAGVVLRSNAGGHAPLNDGVRGRHLLAAFGPGFSGDFIALDI